MKWPQYGCNKCLSKIIVIYILFQQSGDNLIWIQKKLVTYIIIYLFPFCAKINLVYIINMVLTNIHNLPGKFFFFTIMFFQP